MIAHSRKIIIDGKEYRWRAIGSKENIIGWSPGIVDLVVVNPENGKKVVAYYKSKNWTKEHSENPDCAPDHKASVTPKDVARFIRFAITDGGWKPDEKGPQLKLENAPELTDYIGY